MMSTKIFDESLRLLPQEIRQALENHAAAEEIRLRCGYPPSFVIAGRELVFSDVIVCEKHLLHVMDVATGASFHSSSHSIASGYFSYNGIRIGVCGQAVLKSEGIFGFNKITSLAIRIPHLKENILPDEVCSELIKKPANTLILAGPGIGKTTALRDLVYRISESGIRISLLDERGEFVAARDKGLLGKCTDVLSYVKKSEGAILVLRSMNPQIIAMDEITKTQDIDALFEVIGCGVCVIATAHAFGLEDMMIRPLYRKLVEEAVFQNILSISVIDGHRKYTLERIKP